MAERKTKAQQAAKADEQATASTEEPTTDGRDAADTDAPDPAPEEPSAATLAAPAEATSTSAAPLEPPEARQRRLPHMGHPESSTNAVSANVGLSNVAGSNHLQLFDGDGNQLALEEVFEFPEAGSPSNLATVKQRVYEEFTYPNTTTRTTHLLYNRGERVPVFEARRVLDTYKHAEPEELPQP